VGFLSIVCIFVGFVIIKPDAIHFVAHSLCIYKIKALVIALVSVDFE